MKKKFSFKKIIGTVVGIIVGIFFAFSIIVSVYATVSYSKNKMVQVMGYSFHVVVSESMCDTIMVGDMVIAKKINSYSDVDIGDIVVFKMEDKESPIYGQFVIHRVVEKVYENNIHISDSSTDSELELVEGVKVVGFVTKGDNNNYKDKVVSHPIAKTTSIKTSGGNVLMFFTDNRSLVVLLVILCGIVLIGVESFSFVQKSKMLANRKKINPNIKASMTEQELKEMARAEAIRELMEEMSVQNKVDLKQVDQNKNSDEEI